MDDEYFGRTAEESASTQGTEAETENADHSPAAAHLTLAAIEPLTGISYVTLQRYAQQYNDRLPHEGTGRNRRYYPSAVEEFKAIKTEIAERRKGTGAGDPPRGTTRRSKTPSRPRKKKRPAKTPKTPMLTPRRPQTVHARPMALATPVADTSFPAAPIPVADLDRLAKIYQLRLQLKTLDEVAKFVAGWRTRIEAEIKELERLP